MCGEEPEFAWEAFDYFDEHAFSSFARYILLGVHYFDFLCEVAYLSEQHEQGQQDQANARSKQLSPSSDENSQRSQPVQDDQTVQETQEEAKIPPNWKGWLIVREIDFAGEHVSYVLTKATNRVMPVEVALNSPYRADTLEKFADVLARLPGGSRVYPIAGDIFRILFPEPCSGVASFSPAEVAELRRPLAARSVHLDLGWWVLRIGARHDNNAA